MYKVFEAQSRNPQQGDWFLQINEDINEVDLQEIKSMSKYSYKCKVKKAIKKSAFNWLIA